MKYILLFLFMVGLVSAVEVNFDCPSSVNVNEEFRCSLEIFNGEEIYDVKVEIQKDGEDVVKIWNDERGKWQSGYYYLQKFIGAGEKKSIKLGVEKAGDYEGFLKLREGDSREFFDFEIEVLGEKVFEVREDINTIKEQIGEDLKREVVEEDNFSEEIILGVVDKKILLNEVSDKVVYESKDSRIMEFLPYAFCFLLIVLIGVLLWERF